MESTRSSDAHVEIEPYEEIVRDFNYSTPISSLVREQEDRLNAATFKDPIAHSSHVKVIATAGHIVFPPWPALRFVRSLAGAITKSHRHHTRRNPRHLRFANLTIQRLVTVKFNNSYNPYTRQLNLITAEIWTMTQGDRL